MAAALRTGWRCQHSGRPIAYLFAEVRAVSSPRRRLIHSSSDVDEKKNRLPLLSTEPLPPSLPPLIYPESTRSAKHHDLPSFLRYAERAQLDQASTTYVGTHYEYTVVVHLASLGFSLRRVGGASDRGIDLLGVWTLPLPTDRLEAAHLSAGRIPIRVIVQCKAGAGQRIGPHLVRELEGAFVGAPVGWRTRSDEGVRDASSDVAVVGLLVTEKPATKGIRDALARSRWPMVFVCCSASGHIRQMLWNQRAERGGLTGLGVTLRHNNGDGNDQAHVVLTWQGKPLPLLLGEHERTV